MIIPLSIDMKVIMLRCAILYLDLGLISGLLVLSMPNYVFWLHQLVHLYDVLSAQYRAQRYVTPRLHDHIYLVPSTCDVISISPITK